MPDIADGNLWPLGWMLIVYIIPAFYSNILVGNDFYYEVFICIVKYIFLSQSWKTAQEEEKKITHNPTSRDVNNDSS